MLTFDPADLGEYEVGQFITHQNAAYSVLSVPATGVPGASPDYAPLTSGFSAAVFHLLAKVHAAQAYGCLFCETEHTFPVLHGAAPTQVPFCGRTPALLTHYRQDNSITLDTDAQCEIECFFQAGPTLGTTITLTPRKNGMPLDAYSLRQSVAEGIPVNFYNSFTMDLLAGDIIDLVVSTDIHVDLIMEAGTRTSLSLKKIG